MRRAYDVGKIIVHIRVGRKIDIMPLHYKLMGQFHKHAQSVRRSIAGGPLFSETADGTKESSVGQEERQKLHSTITSAKIIKPASETKPCFYARSCVLRMIGKLVN